MSEAAVQKNALMLPARLRVAGLSVYALGSLSIRSVEPGTEPAFEVAQVLAEGGADLACQERRGHPCPSRLAALDTDAGERPLWVRCPLGPGRRHR